MIRITAAAHSSQMYTRGPATNFETSLSFFPQNEQRRRLSLNIPLTSTSEGSFSEGWIISRTPEAV